MGTEDLGNWAAAFLRQYELECGVESERAAPGSSSAVQQKYLGITGEASLLLESIDDGGVPAFVTQALLRIARDNGLEVETGTTPNDVVAGLRRLVAQAGGGSAMG